MANHVIVGSGAAGIAAAEAIRQKDKQGSIRMFTNDPHVYYSRPGLAYVLAGEVPQNQIYPFAKNYIRNLNIQIIPQGVQSIFPSQHTLKTENGKQFQYDRLLLAMGATAAMPKVEGVDLKGVVKLDSMDDIELIMKNIRKSKVAVVIGGGITALELAEGLMASGLKVHYFLRGERYWSNVLDEVESRMVEERLIHDGITIHYFTELAEIHGRNGRVTGVVAKQKDKMIEFPCQMVAFAIGIKPRIELAVQAGLNTQRGIIVDSGLHSSHRDVFAAGDIAQVFDRQSGEYLIDSLWRPAVEQGWIAGLNMTGGAYHYVKKYPFNVTRLGGLVTTIIGRVGKAAKIENASNGDSDVVGIMRGDSEIWRIKSDGIVAETYQKQDRLRLYVGNNFLTGAIVMGDQTLSRPLQVLIREQVDISSIHDKLLSPNESLADTLNSFWERYTQNHAN